MYVGTSCSPSQGHGESPPRRDMTNLFFYPLSIPNPFFIASEKDLLVADSFAPAGGLPLGFRPEAYGTLNVHVLCLPYGSLCSDGLYYPDTQKQPPEYNHGHLHCGSCPVF